MSSFDAEKRPGEKCGLVPRQAPCRVSMPPASRRSGLSSLESRRPLCRARDRAPRPRRPPGHARATPYLVDARDIDPVRHDARFTEQIPDRPSIGCLGDGFHATLAPEVDRGADVVRTTATGWSRSGTSIRARPAGVARHDERPRLVGPEAAVQHLRAAQRRFAGSADLEAAVRSSGHRMARLRRRGPRGAGGALGGVGPELRRAAALSGAISVASAVGGRRRSCADAQDAERRRDSVLRAGRDGCSGAAVGDRRAGRQERRSGAHARGEGRCVVGRRAGRRTGWYTLTYNLSYTTEG